MMVATKQSVPPFGSPLNIVYWSDYKSHGPITHAMHIMQSTT